MYHILIKRQTTRLSSDIGLSNKKMGERMILKINREFEK